jgi:hypothetical protein
LILIGYDQIGGVGRMEYGQHLVKDLAIITLVFSHHSDAPFIVGVELINDFMQGFFVRTRMWMPEDYSLSAWIDTVPLDRSFGRPGILFGSRGSLGYLRPF